MEFFIMGFAMLVAEQHEASTIIAGAVIAILFLLTPGLLKKKSGWILGSLLQLALIGYSVVVPSLAFLAILFAGLWIAAIIVGRKGEAARATLLAQAEKERGAGES
jgi:hypothetical protein